VRVCVRMRVCVREGGGGYGRRRDEGRVEKKNQGMQRALLRLVNVDVRSLLFPPLLRGGFRCGNAVDRERKREEGGR